MSRFYVSASSNSARTEVTRRGTESAEAHVRGWDVGVRVEAVAEWDAERGEYVDAFKVYATGGSNKASNARLLGTVIKGKGMASDRPVFIPSNGKGD